MQIILPRAELQPFVRYFWLLKSSEQFRVLTFPIGCPQLIFHRGTPLFIPELGECQHRFTVSGQVNFPAHIEGGADTEMVVAVFYPHTAGVFIDIPASEFYNQEVSGYDLPDRGLHELADRVFDCRTADDSISVIENWMLNCIVGAQRIDRVGHTVNILLHSPGTSVRDLAGEACLGKKQFERVFNSCVGMNPKEYSRVVRFQKALWCLQRGSTDFTGIACSCGYSDQSHLIREFRRFSGHTPRTLSDYCRPYSDLFTSPV